MWILHRHLQAPTQRQPVPQRIETLKQGPYVFQFFLKKITRLIHSFYKEGNFSSGVTCPPDIHLSQEGIGSQWLSILHFSSLQTWKSQ